ncbi:SAM-dependent DNA methyltransferase [Microbacterium sp. zg.Y1090]|uniref:Eco57I restriction-modification methylase domain-containing protein n=1 Tax=Microbacterium wangruii TaxID=3049073 RepID=UPI00214D0E16|nr:MULTISPECIES: DNA methyltransferase [unclassified Microbacterium]MCR2817311.1 SAM-dependent DNA methyltransferase [Microbacterium sp. zg.Y1090]WIM29201.1 SAM-dependent DNA methyltransferase [Microbacterium sp. zg-Y1090]
MPVDVWEWLSLIDHDGPFLSKAALKSFYPSGLPRPAADETADVFAEEFVRWSAAWTAPADVYDTARDRWVAVVLRRLLDWSDDLQLSPEGLSAQSPNGAVTVTPWAALTGSSVPSALVTVVDRTDDLRSVGSDGWSANAIDRMAVLLRETGVTTGIVTDGRWWALVSAAKDVTTASGVWDALLWREERPSRDAFFALASYTSIAGGDEMKRLPLLFDKSIASAEEITEALGDQVRRAVELVLQSMSDTHLRALAQGEPSPLPEDPKAVYAAAVTVLMRIVFLLFAEERGLLPDHDLYRSSYAIARVREHLQQDATATSEEALDHSWEAWHRLLAASNAVFGGASFQDMRMPAYGGSLFDPARFPWLHATDGQGRLRVRLTDRAMLAVLRAVQTIEDGALRLSFRELDVEQIGYVYEGLLGYSATYVSDVTVGLQGTAGFEPEIALDELEDVAAAASSPADFAERLVKHLETTQKQSRPRTAKQIAKAYGADAPEPAAAARTRLRYALLGNDDVLTRLHPFYGLIRNDLRGMPYVVPADGLVMTESPQRANTGTHYTPRSLAEEVVLHALEPLVYNPGPLDTENRSEWKLKSSAEILDLKVADIAAGSGAFLVAAAHYLADRLIEARAEEGLDVSGEPDLKRWAVREVVARCLYGADINGMAVEMCKLSLWLISMDPGKPFSFVDDRVFHGNSLLGVTTEEQLKAQHIYPERRRGREQLLWFDVDKDLDDAARIRRELSSGQVDDADRMRSTKAKHALLVQADQVTAKLRDVAEGIIAAGLLEGGKRGKKLDDRYDDLADALRAAYPVDGDAEPDRTELDAIIDAGLTPAADTGEARWKPLHWILEAPDVIHTRGGFDAIIGNPPFLGGKKISGASGSNFREFLVNSIANERKGEADLVAYFVLRLVTLANQDATVGMIASESLSEGDGRRVALDPLLLTTWRVHRTVKRYKWPTTASVHVSLIWLTARPQAGGRSVCDGQRVSLISPALEPATAYIKPPTVLSENKGLSFMGVILSGKGFVMSDAEREQLLEEDPSSARVVRPFLTGVDVNGRASPGPSSTVIDFGNLTLSEAEQFPAALRRVRELVKPARDRVKKRQYRERWWQYAERAPGLSAGLQELDAVIAIVLTSDTLMPLRFDSKLVFSNSLGVFLLDDFASLCLLSSSIHQLWAMRWGSSLDAAARYTTSDVFETLPRPEPTDEMAELGMLLDGDRADIMRSRGLGLTALYKRVNSPLVRGDADIDHLRSIHARINSAVVRAFGWDSIQLNHGFYSYRQVERWTVDPDSRVKILDLLLAENNRRGELQADKSRTPAPDRGDNFDQSCVPEGAMF